jgi:3-dehydroquinate synthase
LLPKLWVRTKASAQDYQIIIGRGVLNDAGRIARTSFDENAKKIAVISNATVFSLYGARLLTSLKGNGFTVTHSLIGDGEHHKSFRTAEKALQFFSKSQLDRSDGVVALGGGVVGDLAGFTASIYLRGLPFIQIPTTLLAQIDASIGGKTAINVAEGKNLAGSFHQPRAVLIDIETLVTLPQRELVAGWCEIVKQAAVGSRKLFTQTVDFLGSCNPGIIPISRELEALVLSHCTFKASIVAKDERENASRSDHRSRRILNFGHTIGHALETATRYRYFRHGEAVGYGVLAAGALSKNLGMLPESELELLTDAIRMCGSLPPTSNLDPNSIVEAIRRDKKREGGQNRWVLLERIGRARIVSGKDISPVLIKKSLNEALKTTRP